MDADELRALCRSESDRVEWKDSSLDHADPIVKAVCALANDLGETGVVGRVLVGVDKHGTVRGVDRHGASLDEVQQRLANRLHDITLQPTPSVDLEVVALDGAHVVVISVAPALVPPVTTYRGVAYVRKGTTTRTATEADLARLRERRPEAARPFDVQLVADASLDDLALRNLRDLHEAARLDDEDPDSFPAFEAWLQQRELGRIVEGSFVPNATAILIHGTSPQSWLPGAYVDFVRYAGTDVDAAVAFRATVLGTLPDQLDALWGHVQRNLVRLPAAKNGLREEFVDQYPASALEELIRNVVQHRNYSLTHAPSRIEWFDDRVEMTNPGGPFGHASEGEFGETSDYRNPNLTRELSELGYVQKLGRGVRRARAALQKNGNRPLEVETDGYTRVRVWGRP